MKTVAFFLLCMFPFNNAFATPSLLGEWISACIKPKDKDPYNFNFLFLENSEFVRTKTLYANEDCSDEGFLKAQIKGTFQANAQSNEDSTIDMESLESFITIYDKTVAEAFGIIKACDISNWEVGKTYNTTACEFGGTPNTLYSIIKFKDADHFQPGTTSPDHPEFDGSTPENRHRYLSESMYHRK